jgi:hypothetical protein
MLDKSGVQAVVVGTPMALHAGGLGSKIKVKFRVAWGMRVG